VNLLILQPSLKKFEYSLFSWSDKKLLLDTYVEGFADITNKKDQWTDILARIRQHCRQTDSAAVGAVALTVLFGGDTFTGPVTVSDDTVKKLEALVPQAPLHLPGTLQLIEACKEIFPQVPIVLVFETAFYTVMPERESAYAISEDIAGKMKIKRWGRSGILHEAACITAAENLKKNLHKSLPCIISVSLQPQPEVAAVKGTNRVLMATKAIPGETVCGQIDPAIALILSETLGWGPEKINTVLTRESGLLGLTGKHITIEDVFTQDDPDMLLAREICQYRLLNACGSAAAAMDGVDAIVFSGKYAKLGKTLGSYLADKLAVAMDNQPRPEIFVLNEPKAVSIVKIALTEILPKIHGETTAA